MMEKTVKTSISIKEEVSNDIILFMQKDNRPNFSNAIETLAKLQIEQLKKEGKL
jgi:archaellum component FlaC